MPSSVRATRALVTLLPNDVHGTIYELGSGWGTLLFPVARCYPNHQVIGFETSWIPYFFSRIVLLFCGLPNVEIRRQDFFAADLSEAGLVVCYLYPGAMKKLAVKLSKGLPTGSYVISNTFAMPGWPPESTLDIGDLYHTKIYRYRVR